MKSLNWVGAVSGIIIAFVTLNAFLHSVSVSISDYFIANGFIIIIMYLTFLTSEILNLKWRVEKCLLK